MRWQGRHPDTAGLLAKAGRLPPNAKLKILPGGHPFFIEEEWRFNRAILAFLAGMKK